MNVKLTPEMIEAGYAALTAGYDVLVLTLNPETIRDSLCAAYTQMALKSREDDEPVGDERSLQNYLVWAGRSLSSPRAPGAPAVPDAVDLS